MVSSFAELATTAAQPRSATRSAAAIDSCEVAAVETLRELSALLGLFMKPAATQAAGGNEELTDGLAQLLIKIRQDARANKDFSTADGVRDGLTALGVVLEDRKEGTTWKVE